MAQRTPTEKIQAAGAYRFRPAANDDAVLLWEWANDPITRQNSFNSAAISWEHHEEWFKDKLASPDCRIWILEFERRPLGQIRYERTEANTARISFSVAAGCRGRQLGSLLLRATSQLAAEDLGVNWVEGVTFIENLASQRAFLSAGFTVSGRKRVADRDCVIFSLRCIEKQTRCDH